MSIHQSRSLFNGYKNYIIFIIIICFLATNCATMKYGTSKDSTSSNQDIIVKSDPEGAVVNKNGENVGITPMLLVVNRKKEKKFILRFTKKGYLSKSYYAKIRSKMKLGLGSTLISSFKRGFYRFPNKIFVKMKSYHEKLGELIKLIQKKKTNRNDKLNALQYIYDGLRNGMFTTNNTLISTLTDTLYDSDSLVRYKVALCFGLLGKDSIKDLMNVLTSSDDKKIKGFAVFALGLLGPEAKRCVPVIIDEFPVISVDFKIIYSKYFKAEQHGINRYITGGSGHYTKDEQNLNTNDLRIAIEIKKLKEVYNNYIDINNANGKVTRVDESIAGIYKGYRIITEVNLNVSIFAGAFALSKITGKNLGIEKDKWIKEVNKDRF